MFRNVLVGVDGSAGGRDALALASRLTDPAGKLTLVHVHSEQVYLLPALAAAGALADQSADADGENRSRELLRQEREAAGVDADLLSVSSPSPGEGLHREAEARDAKLLVVGSSRRGLLGRAMLGDDTRAALNGAPCAVAIAAHGFAERPRPIVNVGVGYDGSPESEAALALARTLSGRDGDVRALQVVSIPSYAVGAAFAPELGDTIDTMVAEAQEGIDQLPGVQGRAVYGMPGEELASFSAELDLLVVGSRSYGPLRRAMLGSTSNHLERHARCSLLVLPRGAGEPEQPR